jgi:cytochrome P450
MPLLGEALKDANENIKLVPDYFLGLCKERRDNPTDDLITALVQAADECEALSSDELVSNIIFLFLEGHETTVNLIGNGLWALYNNRDQLELLKSDLSLMPNAVEEILLYESAVQLSSRTASKDIEVAECLSAKASKLLPLSARLIVIRQFMTIRTSWILRERTSGPCRSAAVYIIALVLNWRALRVKWRCLPY